MAEPIEATDAQHATGADQNSVESARDRARRDASSPSPDPTATLCAVAASSLLWVRLFSSQSFAMFHCDPFSAMIALIAAPGGIVAGFALLFFFPNLVGRPRSRVICSLTLALLSTTLAVAAPYAAGASIAVRATVDALAGFAASYAYVQFGLLLTRLSAQSAARTFAICMGLSGAVVVLLSFAPDAISGTVVDMCVPASLLLFLAQPAVPEKRVHLGRLFSSFPETKPLFLELSLCAVACGLCVSGLFFATVGTPTKDAISLATSLSYAIPGVLFLFLTLVLNKRVDFASMQSLMLPATALVLLPILMGPPSLVFACMVIIVVLFEAFEACGSVSMAEISREHDVAPISSFSALRLFGAAGILAGRVLAQFLFGPGSENRPFRMQLMALVLIAVVILWMAANATFKPFSKPYDAITADAPAPPTAQTPTDAALSEEERHEALCAATAERYGFSARESEVFSYLARGRNAEYIGDKLFISEHTVRSHIHRIYRKMNIHSRQELIDVLEEL